ncbi:protein SENSITIVITY TO RED LIGHT REDUCED 1-like [Gastrolobium bilobum]|uniref:protein SENSITIVITY TO RED LIGHT REDUCED 1-like n=1 Tax=Gastrolobium bilobum TaxID=150636 RepID=UPI002AB1C57A|nr:protein SENSITIVITY TO RED LIGHT REDUCED 1-like [Gastrolobium bilobum]XP_061362391.1 protein SENSITIVITY TO RED LIGHT REDUCED 1-like [Gastrolobium bilobum]XP_061362392.1 protein SENSITIVITY TO RED LIGHT REDUCED 1-like [Gastrolobium bilobum]XP_061362393.1 protein SENSITIVITY TO RED LIGHT REDUCED 1-like [Gastrolobium bilobum]XP_061362394.1 protein SENSITIVITY TO RED LIGHT REDUCED 1-like [Gastrolobium bilobum]
MAASAKTLTIDNCTTNGGWTVVLPRRGRQRRKATKVGILEEKLESWAPTDSQTDPNRETTLVQKIERFINRIGSSQFYHTFRDQIQTSVCDYFQRVLGSEMKMQMVIYGIGSVELYEPPRLQLSLAILMRRDFSWVGNIEVFDPILSVTESRVLEALGCSVMSINEHGRREALKPTLFFMPHCEAELYNNLLQANWKLNLLRNMVLFGNSFETYEQHVSVCKNSPIVNSVGHILAVRRFTNEFRIETVSDDYYNAFHDSSWHFFSPVHEIELQFINS